MNRRKAMAEKRRQRHSNRRRRAQRREKSIDESVGIDPYAPVRVASTGRAGRRAARRQGGLDSFALAGGMQGPRLSEGKKKKNRPDETQR